MTDRRALITTYITNSAFQQCLGYRKNTLTGEFISFTKFEHLHFFFK